MRRLRLGVHRVDQRLVAVAQVDRAPQRRLGRCWRFGHVPVGRRAASGTNGWYFSNGIFFGMGDLFRANNKPPGLEAQEAKASVGERSPLRNFTVTDFS